MFFSGSRYQKQATYTVTLPDGSIVTAVQLPLPTGPALLGYHKNRLSDRLDLLANFYLKDATAFWRMCDANNSLVPDALARRPMIAVPRKGS